MSVLSVYCYDLSVSGILFSLLCLSGWVMEFSFETVCIYTTDVVMV